MGDIFQEVEEDIRSDKVRSIWKKYRVYIILLLLLIVCSVGIKSFWDYYKLKNLETRSENYFKAIDLINQDGGIGGIQALNTFSEKNGENENYLTMISNFTEAALRRNNNDLKNSLEIYSVIINGDIDITYKDYAKIQSAEVLMELKNYKEAKVFLSEVTGSLFSNIAKEYTGYIELYEGNTSKAKDIFQEIVDDASVQNTIKDRIKEILVTLK